MTIRLHHAPLSRSLRVRWLLEEMSLDYELVPVASIDQHRTEAFLAKNPLGLLPVLEDAETVVFESGAILEYLLDTYGDRGLRPEPGTPERLRYTEWLHASETVMGPLGEIIVHTSENPALAPVGGVRRPEVAEAQAPIHRRYLAGLDRELATRPYIAGEAFSAADIMLAYFVLGAQMFGHLDAEAFPRVAAYAGRLASRPAAGKALAG